MVPDDMSGRGGAEEGHHSNLHPNATERPGGMASCMISDGSQSVSQSVPLLLEINAVVPPPLTMPIAAAPTQIKLLMPQWVVAVTVMVIVRGGRQSISSQNIRNCELSYEAVWSSVGN